MEWTSLNDLREKYLSFYQKKGHNRLGSFPLIPQDDNSLLLINSGMAPLKKYFTGEKTMPGNRATTCQKCIRTPDIERVLLRRLLQRRSNNMGMGIFDRRTPDSKRTSLHHSLWRWRWSLGYLGKPSRYRPKPYQTYW